MYLLSTFPGPYWGEGMDREPGIMNKTLKTFIQSCMTSATSDVLCSKGEAEAGVRQRLAGRQVGR